MRFSSFGTTINSRQIVNAITLHGIPVFHGAGTHLKVLYADSPLADIIAVYKQGQRFNIVGIGIEGSDKRVDPRMAMEYWEAYRHACDYFYLAAKRFSIGALESKDIGLFDLARMKVIKNPEYLYPDSDFRANLMNRIKNNFKALSNEGEDPFQKSILEF